MGFQTRSTAPQRRVRFPLLLALIGVVITLGLGAYYGVTALVGGTPSSEEVVQAFEDEGLSVGQSYPVDEEPGAKNSPLPKTYIEGTRFEIPAMGKNEGGRVFVFEDEEDLDVLERYYEEVENMPIFGPSLRSHLYQEGLVLLQINGELPKTQADRYGEVLADEV
jgi:hypothetical protein